MRKLAGKMAFVTGGASGVGLALGRSFARVGTDAVKSSIAGKSAYSAVPPGKTTLDRRGSRSRARVIGSASRGIVYA
jgi:NAD(P)-dependent dehydrogenase (short-subunit alcohol dehydrogenase family)